MGCQLKKGVGLSTVHEQSHMATENVAQGTLVLNLHVDTDLWEQWPLFFLKLTALNHQLFECFGSIFSGIIGIGFHKATTHHKQDLCVCVCVCVLTAQQINMQHDSKVTLKTVFLFTTVIM